MSSLISASDLRAQLDDPTLRVLDVRFDLGDVAWGRGVYAEGHIPGAVYLDLDHDLSLPPDERGAHGGRHPLPDPEAFAATLAAAGVGDEHRIVVYDAKGGLFAGRAWWLLRWLGHDDVRVLDGGLAAWRDAGGGLSTEAPSHPSAPFTARPDPSMVVGRDDVLRMVGDPTTLLIDARAPERYRGEHEPLDPRAGHIPSAMNRPFPANLDGPLDRGRFRSGGELREDFAAAEEVLSLGGRVVVYCGSGVSAAHHALAMTEAGLPMPQLYAGSWSDWTSYPDAAVATGDEAD